MTFNNSIDKYQRPTFDALLFVFQWKTNIYCGDIKLNFEICPTVETLLSLLRTCYYSSSVHKMEVLFPTKPNGVFQSPSPLGL